MENVANRKQFFTQETVTFHRTHTPPGHASLRLDG